ncbi:MAG TPA: serine hydrolase domain-containing protein [Vicinamibacteria bacterium]|nr:serine hydrolase domain-containing protein [Vicinamibacteria bacterium]
MRSLTGAALLLPLYACGATSASSPSPAPASLREQVDSLIQPGIASGRWASVMVGVYDRGATAVFAYGRVRPDGPAPDTRTVYEIGSVTKTFTAALLAGLDREGQVRLDDPVRLHLPASVRVPAFAGQEITLLHLATHSSGLPRLPDDLDRVPGFDMSDPYAHYGVDRLFAFLSRVPLARAPGTRYEYSNFAYAVLGQALAVVLQTSWDQAVLSRVVHPLGLADTRVALDPDQQARLATGHDEHGRVTPPWDMNAHAPAGALRSTMQDMLQYVAATLGHGALATDLATCRQPRFAPADQPFQLGLAWHLVPLGRTGRTYVFHNGGTGGFTSFVGSLPERDAGVAILTSSANLADEQGEALLEWLVPR